MPGGIQAVVTILESEAMMKTADIVAANAMRRIDHSSIWSMR